MLKPKHYLITYINMYNFFFFLTALPLKPILQKFLRVILSFAAPFHCTLSGSTAPIFLPTKYSHRQTT